MATIRKRGDKWHVQVRRKGQPTATRSFINRQDAQTWARQVEVKADRHGLPADLRSLERTSVYEIMTRYRDEVVPAKRSAEIETIIINAFLRQRIASLRLSELTASHVASYRDERLTKVKPVTVSRELDILRHAFRIARREWEIPLPSNAFADVTRPKAGKPRTRRLQPGEWDRLMKACESCRNPWMIYLLQLALETGMRRGELLSAEWKHVNPTERTLHLPMTKNGHPRTIPLSSRALAILKELKQRREQGQTLMIPMSITSMNMGWKRLVKRAGLEDFHFHDLRHEAISRFFELGLTVPEVAMISGHKDVRMLFRYTHPKAELVANKLG